MICLKRQAEEQRETCPRRKAPCRDIKTLESIDTAHAIFGQKGNAEKDNCLRQSAGSQRIPNAGKVVGDEAADIGANYAAELKARDDRPNTVWRPS